MMTPTANGITLGQFQLYKDTYDAELLVGLPRKVQYRLNKPIYGKDIWTAYELSWLNHQGVPQVAIAEFEVPADSPNIIESKSFKYYLNSFNQTPLASVEALVTRLIHDLSLVAGASVGVTVWPLEVFEQRSVEAPIDAHNIDHLPVEPLVYQPNPDGLLFGDKTVEGVWCSHLLKTNCPVTGQPDWASLWVGWQGPQIQLESLLCYVISFRQHQGFHEDCVEQIYSDLYRLGNPQDLWVYARYTRRGGLDINPFRSLKPRNPPSVKVLRQ